MLRPVSVGDASFFCVSFRLVGSDSAAQSNRGTPPNTLHANIQEWVTMEDAGTRLTATDDHPRQVRRMDGADHAAAIPNVDEEANIKKLERAGPSAAASTTDARKRLMRDLKAMQKAPEGISAHPFKDDLMHWKAVIFGPEDTCWEGGIFKLELTFTTEYPMSPPKVKFLTPVFHPNIYKDGSICMDIMKSQWSPVYDVSALLLSIQSLLSDPNPNSAANGEAAEMYASQRKEYDARILDLVEKSVDAAVDEDDDEHDEGTGGGSEEVDDQ